MDALLFNTGDGGELNIDDNGVETTDGLETAAYLSLFCGDFWADSLQTDSEFKYPNRFWKLYQEIPVVPKNLSRFEDAAKKDLEELPVSSVTVAAQIIGLNKLKLTCQLDEDLFEFTENWDAMREKIGADYSYKALVAIDFYINVETVSMLTVDGSSGASYLDIDVVFEDAVNHLNESTITSSSAAISTSIVSGKLRVSAVGAGTSTVTVSRAGISRTVSVTGFATLPDVATLKTLKGGKGLGTGGTALYALFARTGSLDTTARQYTRQIFKTDNTITSHVALRVNGAWSGVRGVGTNINNVPDLRPCIYLYNNDGSNMAYLLDTSAPSASQTYYDMARASDGFWFQGASVTPTTFIANPSYSVASSLAVRNCHEKFIIASFDSDGQTFDDMIDPLSVDIYNCFQDFIKYTDIVGRTGRVLVPNRGNAGSDYDLQADNVPTEFLGV